MLFSEFRPIVNDFTIRIIIYYLKINLNNYKIHRGH